MRKSCLIQNTDDHIRKRVSYVHIKQLEPVGGSSTPQISPRIPDSNINDIPQSCATKKNSEKWHEANFILVNQW